MIEKTIQLTLILCGNLFGVLTVLSLPVTWEVQGLLFTAIATCDYKILDSYMNSTAKILAHMIGNVG